MAGSRDKKLVVAGFEPGPFRKRGCQHGSRSDTRSKTDESNPELVLQCRMMRRKIHIRLFFISAFENVNSERTRKFVRV